MLSDQLYYLVDKDEEYSSLSFFVNDCINGYRNITYVRQQQAVDSSFTIEQAKTPKHTYIALNNAIKPSIQLYKFLQKSNKFNKKQLLSFSRYMKTSRLDNPFRYFHGRVKEDVSAQKEIFDYIIANPNNINYIVTNKMIEEFKEQYKAYQEDAQKYGHETIEERRDHLNNEIVAKGGRAMRFP